MAEKPPSQASEKKLAKPDEVVKAIASLTEGQLLRLKESAKWKIRGLGRRAMGRDYQDLLNEAITRTLEGTRNWPKSTVDFMGCLIGTMRSISSNWAESFDPEEAALDSEVIINTEEGESISPINKAEAPGISQEDNLIAKQEIERIEGIFEKDETVLLIIEGLRSEMTGPEIQEAIDITKTEFETAMKRMRRKVREMEMGEETHG
jgi:hypothetical protein